MSGSRKDVPYSGDELKVKQVLPGAISTLPERRWTAANGTVMQMKNVDLVRTNFRVDILRLFWIEENAKLFSVCERTHLSFLIILPVYVLKFK